MSSTIAEINNTIRDTLLAEGALGSVSVRTVDIDGGRFLRIRYTKGFDPRSITLWLADDATIESLLPQLAEHARR
jgi:hypothetical protein